ncbi:MAG TPA: YHS domain-containing (seleno)protein [Geminicoccaceae bacterium]|nr:YHS domain-containing (seleno)protein [Geminicoccaceae bacterium]
MASFRTTRALSSLLFGLMLAVAALPAEAEGVVNASSWTGTAIEGYDPVAYFEQGRPVEGDSDYSYDWMGATWYFASAENRDRFAADPDRYAPQYGGYCAWAVANGYTAKIDPEAWAVVDDKLYLNYSQDVQRQWQQDVPGNISKADANWPAIREELAN